MKTLVVYDSYFNNTKKIAQAISKALKPKNTDAVYTNDIKLKDLKDVGLLIVGSPTRAFSPTPPIKAFLNKIPSKSLQGVKIAAFDTRMSLKDVDSKFLTFMAGIFGFAAEPIAKKLKNKGGEQVIAPEGFIVAGMEGPLKEGELKRAENWAKLILK